MIKILVEGNGDEISLPILLKRLKGADLKIQCLDMGGKSNIVRLNDGFEKTILRQTALGYTKFAVLLDGDKCPPYKNLRQETDGMQSRAKQLEQNEGIKIKIFWAIREYESWIIGGLKRGDRFCGLSKTIRGIPGDTQSFPPDPKQWIKNHRSDGKYNPEVQKCLTMHMNLKLARKRNASLHTFLDDI